MARILKQPSKTKIYALYIFIWLVGIYSVFVSLRALRQSIVLDSLDRVNVVYYGKDVELISFGIKDDVNYIVSFSHNDNVSVPGGYGRYNVGALGKLAQIEKDQPLIGRTFSSMISAHVDYYVMPKKPDVYDGEGTDDPMFEPRQLISQLFSSSYATNAHFFDKLYLSYLLSKHRQKDFAPLRSISEITVGKEANFSERRFLKKYKGFFYHQSLREEGKQVKVLYDSYSSAVTLSRVIEGQGIRIADLSESDDSRLVMGCRVTYADDGSSKTLHYLQRTFGCAREKAHVEGADMILTIGAGVAERWK